MATNTRSTFRKDNLFRPTPFPAWKRLQRNPLRFIAQWLYSHQPPMVSPAITASPVKVACISDTHNEQPRLPNGDILIHAGDLTVNGTFAELQAQLNWLNTLPHTHKIVVAGNHDLLLDQTYYTRHPNQRLAGPENDKNMLKALNWGSIIYLNQSSTTLDVRGESIRVYGSPVTPQYGNWAFQYLPIEDVWRDMIPSSADIVVTHGPVKGHVDGNGKGCPHLNRELWRIKPRLHVCGHIHEARGVEYANWGWLQWGYDATSRGDGSIAWTLLMLVIWFWMWFIYLVSGPRKSRTAFVNAAVVGTRELIEGDKTIVVEI